MKLTRILTLCLAATMATAIAHAQADDLNQQAAKARQLLEEGATYSALREGERMFHASEEQGDQTGLAIAYNIIGEVSAKQRNYERAADNFRQALLILTTQVKSEKARTAYTYYNYTLALQELGNTANLKKAIDDWEDYLDAWKEELTNEAQPTQTLNEDYIRLKLAKADYLIAAQKPDEAYSLLQEAEKMKTTKTADFDRLMAEHYTRYYQAKGNTAKALEANSKCRKYDEQKNDTVALIDDLMTQAQLLMESGKKQEAANVFRVINDSKDRVTRTEMTRMLKEMYEYYQVDERIAEENRRAERTRTVMLNLLILSLCLVATALVFAALSRRKMVKELRKSTDQLAVANERLEKANKQAMLSAEMKEAFIRHVSHEIRTPLNIIGGFTQVLSMPGFRMKPEERQHIVAQMNTASKNITNIMHNLKQLADMEQISELDHSTSIGCDALCETAAQQSGVKENDKYNFKIDNQFPQDKVIKTNDRAVVEILRELLVNAQKFAKQGNITLSCEQETQGKVRFAVTDNGKKIPRQEASHIFEVFVKLDEYDTGIGGGLAVCKSLAERLGGEVWLNTDYREGNQFVLELKI